MSLRQRPIAGYWLAPSPPFLLPIIAVWREPIGEKVIPKILFLELSNPLSVALADVDRHEIKSIAEHRLESIIFE